MRARASSLKYVPRFDEAVQPNFVPSIPATREYSPTGLFDLDFRVLRGSFLSLRGEGGRPAAKARIGIHDRLDRDVQRERVQPLELRVAHRDGVAVVVHGIGLDEGDARSAAGTGCCRMRNSDGRMRAHRLGQRFGDVLEVSRILQARGFPRVGQKGDFHQAGGRMRIVPRGQQDSEIGGAYSAVGDAGGERDALQNRSRKGGARR